jgi:hypothetical protein
MLMENLSQGRPLDDQQRSELEQLASMDVNKVIALFMLKLAGLREGAHQVQANISEVLKPSTPQTDSKNQ